MKKKEMNDSSCCRKNFNDDKNVVHYSGIGASFQQ